MYTDTFQLVGMICTIQNVRTLLKQHCMRFHCNNKWFIQTMSMKISWANSWPWEVLIRKRQFYPLLRVSLRKTEYLYLCTLALYWCIVQDSEIWIRGLWLVVISIQTRCLSICSSRYIIFSIFYRLKQVQRFTNGTTVPYNYFKICWESLFTYE